MKKILVGQFDRTLGTVALDPQGNWLLEPQPDVTTEELQATLDSVFARVRRCQRSLTRPQFMQKFFGKFAPITASASSAWAKRVTSDAQQKIVNALASVDDPYMVETRRYYQQLASQKSIAKQA